MRKRKENRRTPIPSSLVSIIIPVMGRFDLLKMCLDSIPLACKNIQHEVILVDNNSPQEEASKFYSELSGISIIKNKSNFGFPKACNQGATRAKSPLLFFLNSDVILKENSIDFLVKDLDDPKIAVSGMMLLFPEYAEGLNQEIRPSGKVQHVGMDTNIHGKWIHTFVGWDSENTRVQAQRKCYAVTGAALMTRRKLFFELGGFDELYGLGCLTGNSLLITDKGIVELKDLMQKDDKEVDYIDIGIASETNLRRANLSYINGEKETLKIKTEKGFSLQGTYNHRIRVMSEEGEIIWKRLDELKIGDYVGIRYGTNLFGTIDLDKDDAYFIGTYIANGSNETCGRITITTQEAQTQEFLSLKYGFSAIDEKKIHWRKQSVDLYKKFGEIIDWKQKAITKTIPDVILRSNKETQIAFLQGLFDGDGCAIKDGRVTYSTSSYRMAQQLQIMLLNFGIVVGIYPRTGKLSPRENYLFDFGSDSGKFYSDIGFRLLRKQERLSLVRERRSETIPYQRKLFESLFNEMIDYNKIIQSSTSSGVKRESIKLLVDTAIKEGKTYKDSIVNHFGEILLYECVWLKVKSIEDFGVHPTFDIHVPTTNAYVANGFIVHNTFEDVDFCMKVKSLDYDIVVNPKAVGIHYTGASAEFYRIGFPMDYNRLIFLQKWADKLKWTEYERW